MPTEKPNILLIEDEEDFRQTMQKSFGQWYRFVYAPTLKSAAMSLQGNFQYDLVLMDLSFDHSQRLEGLQHIQPFKRYVPDTPLVVVTKNNEAKNALAAMRAGADEYLWKHELDVANWRSCFDELIGQGAAERARPAAVAMPASPALQADTRTFVGETPAIQAMKNRLEKLSTRPDVTVLLLGETGVGKEVAARYLHQRGVRCDKPFKAVNLSTITANLMESALFGHRRGAFTDAKSDQKGAFAEADGGILFLDEIGEIDASIQVKLLRFLEDKIIQPVGGEEIKLDVQIVAATNRNLQVEVQAGRFRNDLYQRLAGFPVQIPPLRERPEDIPLLLTHYLQQESKDLDLFTPAALSFLMGYAWPGNIRELVNVVRRSCITCDFDQKTTLDQHEIPLDTALGSPLPHPLPAPTPRWNEAAERELRDIENALRNANGSKGKAAAALGLNLDKLKYWIDKHVRENPGLVEQFPYLKQRYKL